MGEDRGEFGAHSLGPKSASPERAVGAALRAAQMSKADCLADIGCNDGRVLIRAALEGACGIAVGIDIDWDACVDARKRAEQGDSTLSLIPPCLTFHARTPESMHH